MRSMASGEARIEAREATSPPATTSTRETPLMEEVGSQAREGLRRDINRRRQDEDDKMIDR